MAIRLDDALATLAKTKGPLPDEVRKAILDAGEGAVPGLLRVLVTPSLRNPSGAAEGWPPVHAVDCLVDLRATRALAAMLQTLVESDPDELVHERLLDRLPDLGEDLVEPALGLLEQFDDPATVDALATVLANAGVHDDRIWSLLLEIFGDDPAVGATLLADYGDPRALPLVGQALASYRADAGYALARVELEEIAEAYEALGGTIDEAVAAKLEELRANEPELDAEGDEGDLDEEDGVLEEQILAFGQPLLEAADGDEATRRAFEVVLVCWDLALTEDDGVREKGIEEMVEAIPDAVQQDEARGILRAMIERHRRMYPEMHARA